MPRFLNPDHTFNRAAILRTAWNRARHEVEVCTRLGIATTLRAAFAHELRQAWADARAERPVSAADKARAEAAEARRVAALSDSERQIEAARFDLLIAQHNDTIGAHVLIAEANARLRSLQHAA